MRQDSRNWVTLGGEKRFHMRWEPLTICKEPELGFFAPRLQHQHLVALNLTTRRSVFKVLKIGGFKWKRAALGTCTSFKC